MRGVWVQRMLVVLHPSEADLLDWFNEMGYDAHVAPDPFDLPDVEVDDELKSLLRLYITTDAGHEERVA